ncbi:MAG: phosphate ABC transporter permease PstA [Thermoplasmata archaeon]|jgi:phosphate transport system permease protein|nr:phosphate ABC transporter permease PstA [Thermoplasmatales archaeon]PMP74495.1 MAG: phosphate ABC transporter, permease protein PstA [Aciduliprofundum sp.]
MSIRILKDLSFRIIGYAIIIFIMIILIYIVGGIVFNGVLSIRPSMLIENGDTTSGGLLNAIVGTWMLVGTGILFSVPLGVFAAVFIVEYGWMRYNQIIRIFTDILTSIPSIVLGLFGYLFLVIQLGFGYSLLAGGITLGIMMLPYILRITEISLSEVPRSVREAAISLGARRTDLIFRVMLPYAKNGIITSTILAMSIGAGETAQLLYTAGWNNSLPVSFIKSQVAYLTYVIWAGINQPSLYSHQLAFASAFILIVSVFSLIFISKFIKR